jgi:short-subunit dehydrogenase
MAEGRPLAVVTGASSGIGFALAAEFVEHGHDVVIAADTDAIMTAAEDLDALPSPDGEPAEVYPVQCDLATPEGVEHLANTVASLGRPVEHLAVNAGIGVNGGFVDTSLDDHLRLVELNVSGAVRLAGRLLPSMAERGEGGVLFTSSIAGTMPGPYESTYAASKAFLLSFAEALHVELADRGVRVTALMPGPTDTNFFARAGMEDTKLGRSRKDDPRQVAHDGYEALVKGDDHVVAGSLRNKVQAVASRLLPDETTAQLHAAMNRPASASGSESPAPSKRHKG